MTLTEAKIREAQEIIEQMMKDCEFDRVVIDEINGISGFDKSTILIRIDTTSLADLYINRLRELAGTTPPPF